MMKVASHGQFDVIVTISDLLLLISLSPFLITASQVTRVNALSKVYCKPAQVFQFGASNTSQVRRNPATMQQCSFESSSVPTGVSVDCYHGSLIH